MSNAGSQALIGCAFVSLFVTGMYVAVLLRVYRPRTGAQHFQLGKSRLMGWVNRHPFVPLPASIVIFSMALAILVNQFVAWVVLGVVALIAAITAVRIGAREPTWAVRAREYVRADSSYVAGHAERVEWAVAMGSLTFLAVGLLAVDGLNGASIGIVLIVIGTGVQQAMRRAGRRK